MLLAHIIFYVAEIAGMWFVLIVKGDILGKILQLLTKFVFNYDF